MPHRAVPWANTNSEPRNDQSCKTSRDDLPPEQVKSTHQRVSDSSDRTFYKLVESLTARIQVLEDRDQAYAHAERQQYGSRHETTHISDVNANRSLYKMLEAALARLTVLESRRDICYRYAFKAADGEECMIRGCSTTSSSTKNAIRHIKNTATPEHEVAAVILQQTECLQCDQKWERPSGLAHHETTVHQETCSSRMDAFKPFIEQPLCKCLSLDGLQALAHRLQTLSLEVSRHHCRHPDRTFYRLSHIT